MKAILAVLAILLCAGPIMAETYSWVDDDGTVNFTEDYSSIPKKYRKKAKRREYDVAPAPKKQEPPDVTPEKKGNTQINPVNVETEKGGLPGKAYGGKTVEEWQRELSELEKEVNSLGAKVKEIELERKRVNGNPRELSQRLFKSHSDAVENYNNAIARYNQLVEAARKAGIQVDIRK